MEQEGDQRRLVARLARDPNQFLSTIQIGITLAGFLASAAAAVSLAEPLIPLLEVLGGAAELVAVVLVTMVLTYLTLVVGELAPKRIALQAPERWARWAARPLAVISKLTRPAVWLLSRSTDLLVPGSPDADGAVDGCLPPSFACRSRRAGATNARHLDNRGRPRGSHRQQALG
jgi:putative hemolysin